MESKDIKGRYKMSLDQRIALAQVTALENLASAISRAFEYPVDLSVGKPINDLASAVEDVARALYTINKTLEHEA